MLGRVPGGLLIFNPFPSCSASVFRFMTVDDETFVFVDLTGGSSLAIDEGSVFNAAS